MRAVLDTNIFVSGIFWNGASGRVLANWKSCKFDLVSSIELIEELKRTLKNFKIPLSEKRIQHWVNMIIENSIMIEPTERFKIVKDPDDDKFFETAVAGDAGYLVSQDKEVLAVGEFRGVHAVKPKEFLEVL